MTMPTLMHPHHTVDPFDCTTGPHRLSQPLIDLQITLTPIRAKPTTKDLLQDHHLLSPHMIFTLGLSHQPTQGPSMDQRLSQHGLRHRRAPLLMQAIHMTQRSGIRHHALRLTPRLTLELSTRLVKLRLRSLSTIEMA